MNIMMRTYGGTVSTVYNYASRRFLWPRDLRRESAAARLLGLRVRIPPREHGYLSVVIVVCCQVEVSASGLSLVQRSPTDRVCVCVCVCMCITRS